MINVNISLIALKRVKYVMIKPCPKDNVDSITDNIALVVPCPKKDDKLIVSFNLKDIKSKDDDSCNSFMVSISLKH